MQQLSWATVLLAVVLFMAMIGLLSRKLQFFLIGIFAKRPLLIFLVPLILFGIYVAHAFELGDYSLSQFFAVAVYFFLPTLFCFLARKKVRRLTIWDVAALIYLWLFYDFHLLGGDRGRAPGQMWHYFTIIALATILGLLLAKCLRQLDGIKIGLEHTSRDYLWLLTTFTALSLIFLIIGLRNNFLSLAPLYEGTTSHWVVLWRIVHKLTSWQFIGNTIGIALVIGFPQELLFRGIIQNILQKIGRALTQKNVALPLWSLVLCQHVLPILITSILFGASHLNNEARGWELSQWNWRFFNMAFVMSIGASLLFLKTKSLIFPVALHTLIDSCWLTFFKT